MVSNLASTCRAIFIGIIKSFLYTFSTKAMTAIRIQVGIFANFIAYRAYEVGMQNFSNRFKR